MQIAEDYGINNASWLNVSGFLIPKGPCGNASLTETTPERCNSLCKGFPGSEILRRNDGAWEKQAAKAYADHEALRNENLPVSLADTRNHHPPDAEKGADPEQAAEIARVVNRSCRRADQEKQKCLDGSDPRDARKGLRAEESGLVEGLILSVRVDDSPVSSRRD